MKRILMAVGILSLCTVSLASAQTPNAGWGLYNDEYLGLKKMWGDDIVTRAFEKALQAPSEFVADLKAKYGAVKPSAPAWMNSFGDAIKSAQAGDWKQAQKLSTTALMDSKNSAMDVYLFDAVASKQTGDQKAALSQIKSLYELRKHESVNLANEGAALGAGKPQPGGLVDSVEHTGGREDTSQRFDILLKQYGAK